MSTKQNLRDDSLIKLTWSHVEHTKFHSVNTNEIQTGKTTVQYQILKDASNQMQNITKGGAELVGSLSCHAWHHPQTKLSCCLQQTPKRTRR